MHNNIHLRYKRMNKCRKALFWIGLFLIGWGIGIISTTIVRWIYGR